MLPFMKSSAAAWNLPQKQRVSSMVALQCKQTGSGVYTLYRCGFVCAISEKDNDSTQLYAPRIRLHPSHCICPSQAGGCGSLTWVRNCRCNVQNVCQHELSIPDSRQCGTEQHCDACNYAGWRCRVAEGARTCTAGCWRTSAG